MQESSLKYLKTADALFQGLIIGIITEAKGIFIIASARRLRKS
jgi:hypothetical protein